MDSTPAKRRKISHTSSPGLPNRSASTPSKPASRDGPQTTPRRASFRSPTKASLARFNPELVGRPQSASSADRRIKTRRDGGISSARRRLLSPPISRGSQSQAETAATTNFQRSTRSSIARSSLAPTDDSQLPGGPQEITPAPSLEETKNNNNNNNNENGPGSRVEEMTATQRLLQTPPRRRSRLNDRFEVVWSDLKTGPILEGAPIHARSTISARGPIRTPVGLRRQRKRNTTVEEDDEEEPDLPSTPSRSGNRSVTKVPGGLFSSPSLRSRKKEDKTSRGPSSLAREAPTTTSVHPEESESNVQPVDEEEDIPNVDDSLEAPPAQAGQEIRDQLLIELKDLQEEIKQLEKQVSAATITAQTHKHRRKEERGVG
ncbi:MAG: hypothetical protein M1823_000198 [Watsoniomyces obsoletus]|nr:MAG: hypothetical protein M1823_000198 [Watsoniomyces obsoletus]